MPASATHAGISSLIVIGSKPEFIHLLCMATHAASFFICWTTNALFVRQTIPSIAFFFARMDPRSLPSHRHTADTFFKPLLGLLSNLRSFSGDDPSHQQQPTLLSIFPSRASHRIHLHFASVSIFTSHASIFTLHPYRSSLRMHRHVPSIALNSTWCDPSIGMQPISLLIDRHRSPLWSFLFSRRHCHQFASFPGTISNKCWMIEETCLFDETVQFIRNCKHCHSAASCACGIF